MKNLGSWVRWSMLLIVLIGGFYRIERKIESEGSISSHMGWTILRQQAQTKDRIEELRAEIRQLSTQTR